MNETEKDLRGTSKHVVASRSICLIPGRCVVLLCPWLPSMPVWLLVFHIYAVPTPRLVCFESSLCRFGCQFLSGLSLSRVLCESLCNPDDNIHLMISQLNYVSCAVSVSLLSCGHACIALLGSIVDAWRWLAVFNSNYCTRSLGSGLCASYAWSIAKLVHRQDMRIKDFR